MKKRTRNSITKECHFLNEVGGYYLFIHETAVVMYFTRAPNRCFSICLVYTKVGTVDVKYRIEPLNGSFIAPHDLCNFPFPFLCSASLSIN